SELRFGAHQSARRRLGTLLIVILAVLAAAAYSIELLHDARITLFQLFRLATLERGLCLIFIAFRVDSLWQRGTRQNRARAAAILAGLTGDWTFVVATCAEVCATFAERFDRSRTCVSLIVASTWTLGCVFLSMHDTQSGQLRLGLAL